MNVSKLHVRLPDPGLPTVGWVWFVPAWKHMEHITPPSHSRLWRGVSRFLSLCFWLDATEASPFLDDGRQEGGRSGGPASGPWDCVSKCMTTAGACCAVWNGRRCSAGPGRKLVPLVRYTTAGGSEQQLSVSRALTGGQVADHSHRSFRLAGHPPKRSHANHFELATPYSVLHTPQPNVSSH